MLLDFLQEISIVVAISFGTQYSESTMPVCGMEVRCFGELEANSI
jgi:hypothetical protein